MISALCSLDFKTTAKNGASIKYNSVWIVEPIAKAKEKKFAE